MSYAVNHRAFTEHSESHLPTWGKGTLKSLTPIETMKKNEIFYTATLGQGAAEFTLIPKFGGQGVYIGERFRANEEQLALYHDRLRADNKELPTGDVIVVVLRAIVMGDVINNNCAAMVDMYQAFESVLENDYAKRKAAPSDYLYYVGSGYAGRIDKLRPMLNAFARKEIREGLAEAILANTGSSSRWRLDRYQMRNLRDYSARM